jgi:hypothetical protein
MIKEVVTVVGAVVVVVVVVEDKSREESTQEDVSDGQADLPLTAPQSVVVTVDDSIQSSTL